MRAAKCALDIWIIRTSGNVIPVLVARLLAYFESVGDLHLRVTDDKPASHIPVAKISGGGQGNCAHKLTRSSDGVIAPGISSYESSSFATDPGVNTAR